MSQGNLFEGGKLDGAGAGARVPDPADIRRRLGAVLETARQAERMPWGARDARMWQAVFPQMANWLPEGEAAALRLAFAAEMKRLQAAGLS